MLSAAALRTHARALGFNRLGLARARPAPHVAAYFRWVAAHYHGTMNYMARPDRQARRADLNVIVPGARTLIIVGVDYHTLRWPENTVNDPLRGRIAAYAWGRDYHALMLPRLQALAEAVRAPQWKAYVDTGAILERSHAHEAGLGFIGKNTLLIDPRGGSEFFLGEIITDAEVDEYDTPARETQCGTCTRCLTACPTRAFPQPYVLDARRCISYLTIEHAGAIDADLRPLMGNWIFGCDVCQTVCPWNRFAVQTLEPEFFPADVDRAAPWLSDILLMDDAAFAARFTGTPIQRIGRARLVRNACIAAGNAIASNARRPELIPPLTTCLADPDAEVRAQAAWALARVQGV